MTIKFGTSMAYTESIFDCAASVLNLRPKNQFNESNQNIDISLKSYGLSNGS